ncbi:hypothetical protein FBEOM_7223 [Fusarium beomiforme]|uniref:Uncharacterized protein n=1 Tax=Fusarium beomiforme TaxID=44412 RepID=A0A9P5AJ91_9HYPO|nr:hypothetical protein FBEOM_7223 [Fusarium beomiforme]
MSEHSSSTSQGNKESLKLESDTEDSVQLSDIPKFPHDPETKPKLPVQLQKESTPGNEGGKEREDSSQPQNSTAKETKFVFSLSPNKNKRKAAQEDISTNSPKRVQFKAPSATGSRPKVAIPYGPRNQFRSIFINDKEDDDEKFDRDLRDEYINTLDEQTLRRLEKYIYEIFKKGKEVLNGHCECPIEKQ